MVLAKRLGAGVGADVVALKREGLEASVEGALDSLKLKAGADEVADEVVCGAEVSAD